MNDTEAALQTQPYLALHGSRGIKHIPLVNASAWKLGRDRENDIPLSDKCASRSHAMVQIIGQGAYYLIDLGSRNGSFLNGRRVTIPVSLKNGDRITLGETNLEFFCPETNTAPNDEGIGQEQNTDTVMLHSRRLITVVVIDIRNFTKLTQQLDEHILSEVIGTWFRKAGEIINHYDSWVDKYIGDAVMAVWIHNTSPGTDQVPTKEMLKAFQALHALFDMSNQLNSEFALPFTLRVGAGMNTGYAMVGQMGTSERPDYTALGDTVNAAFRLESATKELGLDVALGEKTYAHTPYAAVLLPFKQQIVNLKGYDNPTLTYAGTFEDLAQFLHKITPQE
ncbi:adenylate/guanylate cyclase domain-containing protein [Tumidithrix elongata RA019]|uniref:Adenylate/guanylate cyclase domain-containing protein n=1 Tax=Tumidithrix elongata BACA0141 TaxID=2716417 RepID=A0AAW9PRE8_9CYAN|nr:adenylate/guanylate cyclase domain-containing protein [Tumidithrix elongata RA019]